MTRYFVAWLIPEWLRRSVLNGVAATALVSAIPVSAFAQNNLMRDKPLTSVSESESFFTDITHVFYAAQKENCQNSKVANAILLIQNAIDDLNAFWNHLDLADPRYSDVGAWIRTLQKDLAELQGKNPCNMPKPPTPPGGGLTAPNPAPVPQPGPSATVPGPTPSPTPVPEPTPAPTPSPSPSPTPETVTPPPSPEEYERQRKKEEEDYNRWWKRGQELTAEDLIKYLTPEQQQEYKDKIAEVLRKAHEIAELRETLTATNYDRIKISSLYNELLVAIAHYEELFRTAQNKDDLEELEALKKKIEETFDGLIEEAQQLEQNNNPDTGNEGKGETGQSKPASLPDNYAGGRPPPPPAAPQFADTVPSVPAPVSDDGPVTNSDGSTSKTTIRSDSSSTTTVKTTTYSDGSSEIVTTIRFNNGNSQTQVQHRDGSTSNTNVSTENGVTTTTTIDVDKDKNRTAGKSVSTVGTLEKESSSTTLNPEGAMIHQTVSKTDKDGNTTVTETDKDGKQTVTTTGGDGTPKGTYKVIVKDGGVYVEWDLPSGSGEGNWYPPGTEIKPNLTGDDPKPFTATPPVPPPPAPPVPTAEETPSEEVPSEEKLGEMSQREKTPLTIAEEEKDRTSRTSLLARIKLAEAQRLADIQAGNDVAKGEVTLIDRKTQQEIPTGELVLIPQDKEKTITPPVRLTERRIKLPPLETVKIDTPKTVVPKADTPPINDTPPAQPDDTVVVLSDCHEKAVVKRAALADGGARIALSPMTLRMTVRNTSCAGVTDSMVDRGLADQYRVKVAGAWKGSDVSFGANKSCVVQVPSYAPLSGGAQKCEISDAPPTPGKPIEPSPGNPKDGQTVLDGGTIIEGDQPRRPQGPAPTAKFVTSSGSWGQSYGDQWWLKSINWLKPDGTTVLPAKGTLVTVAVIDTGVDFSHPQLAGATWINPKPDAKRDVTGWNFIDDDADVQDQLGHGTVVAGIIAASGNGGIAGINPWARIMALKAMDLDGHGGSIKVAEAIGYAVDHGARVINLSLGGRTPTQNEQDALDYAAQKGVLVVAASGNLGIETTRFSPSGLRNVLTVAAVGPDGKRPLFSNWGSTVAIAAPGVDILSLRARQTDLLQMIRKDYKPGTAIVGNDYYRVTGSSFSAPMVAGAASLLFSIDPSLTAEQVKRMLLQSASDIEGIGLSQFSGYGLLNVAAAIAANPNAFIDAGLSGAAPVMVGGKQLVRLIGTANSDALQEAHVEIGMGDDPKSWKKAGSPIIKAVQNGAIADLPPQVFSGGKIWTIRLVVTSKSGKSRQARFKLHLG
jgi:hypothetical protein